MDSADIQQAIRDFARAARRVVDAGLDAIELHSSNGYQFNQFMSSPINDRKDSYGGSLAIGRRIDRSVKEERRAIRGAKGGELIAAMLEGLGDRFLVFHDLPSPYGNIEHLVVSKQTVFLVETKAHGGRVSVNGQIQVNQRSPEKDFIAQVLSNTS